MKRNNPMYGETSFVSYVSYTVCVNHVVEKVVSSAARRSTFHFLEEETAKIYNSVRAQNECAVVG